MQSKNFETKLLKVNKKQTKYFISTYFQAILLEKLKYAIYFCKSIDTDEYARVAMVDPTEPTASESDIESEVSEEM